MSVLESVVGDTELRSARNAPRPGDVRLLGPEFETATISEPGNRSAMYSEFELRPEPSSEISIPVPEARPRHELVERCLPLGARSSPPFGQ